MATNLATVQLIYEAFGKGDIPTILSHVADDVKWDSWADNSGQQAGVPWLRAQSGIAGVKSFFEVIGKMQFTDFRVLSLMAGERQVAAEVALEVHIPDTDVQLRDEEIHLWTFNAAGKVVRFRHYVDTHKHIKAAQMAEAVF